MEFEDIQALWKNQNEEALFSVNEKALYATIRQKSKKIRYLLEFMEWVMIGINLIAGLMLLSKLLQSEAPGYPVLLPATYLAFSVYSAIRRLGRRKKETHFEPTILGELDKAIWQVDYLIHQGRAMTLWYVLPLVLVIAIATLYNPKLLPTLGLILLMLPASYFGVRWEINKWHLPKKRALESLRQTLIAPEI